jgi:hypothetical protein
MLKTGSIGFVDSPPSGGSDKCSSGSGCPEKITTFHSVCLVWFRTVKIMENTKEAVLFQGIRHLSAFEFCLISTSGS